MLAKVALISLLAGDVLSQTTTANLLFPFYDYGFFSSSTASVVTQGPTAIQFAIPCSNTGSAWTLLEGPSTYQLVQPSCGKAYISEECTFSKDVATCQGTYGEIEGSQTTKVAEATVLTGLSSLYFPLTITGAFTPLTTESSTPIASTASSSHSASPVVSQTSQTTQTTSTTSHSAAGARATQAAGLIGAAALVGGLLVV